MEIWAITCDEMPDRARAARETFRAAGLDVRYFRGIHGSTWGLMTTLADENGYRMSAGHVGLSLSHWSLWQLLQHRPADEFLIFEDDAIPCPNFLERLRTAQNELPDDWEVCFVGHLNADTMGEPITPRLRRLSGRYPHGTHAMLIRKTALGRLIETNCLARTHIDLQIAERSLPMMKVYALIPSLVSQRTCTREWPTSTRYGDAVDAAELVPGWMSRPELEWLAAMAAGLPERATWLEIGAYCGRSTLCVGLSLPKNATLHVVDGWEEIGSIYHGTSSNEAWQRFTKTIELLQEKRQDLTIKVWQINSGNVGRFINPGSCDVTFIDGDHAEGAVTRDCANCEQLLKPDGLLCGHDYRPGANDDVVRAVDRRYTARKVWQTIWSMNLPNTTSGDSSR